MTEEEREMLESMDDSGGGGGGGNPKLKRLIMLVVIVAIQAAAAWAVAQFVILPRLPGTGAEADSTEMAEEVEEDPVDRERGAIVMLENVVVNVQTLDGETRFLSVSTGVEFNDKKLDTEIAERMPELRAMLIDHLSSCTVEDVINRQGREIVKEEILRDFNRNLQQGELLNIYFSDFVIQ